MALDRKAQQEIAAFARKQKIKKERLREELDEAGRQRQANLDADAQLALRDYERAKQRVRQDDFLLTPMRPEKPRIRFTFLSNDKERDWGKIGGFFKYLKFWKPFTWLWNFKI